MPQYTCKPAAITVILDSNSASILPGNIPEKSPDNNLPIITAKMPFKHHLLKL